MRREMERKYVGINREWEFFSNKYIIFMQRRESV